MSDQGLICHTCRKKWHRPCSGWTQLPGVDYSKSPAVTKVPCQCSFTPHPNRREMRPPAKPQETDPE